MNKKLLLLPLSLLILSSCTNVNNNDKEILDYDDTKQDSDDQFDFEGNYVAPELKIDGIKDDPQWKNASETITFGSTNDAKVNLYKGEKALFAFFEVKDIDIETVGNNNGDDVTHGDSVEIYFDFKNDATPKPAKDDIQINIGAHGKTRIFVGGGGQWGSWNGLLDYAIKLDGTINDNTDIDVGYNIELMIPYAQIGIDKTSLFGVSLGHVARGRDSTSTTLLYTWGGLTFDGSFIDPQSPASYIVLYNNKFYSRNNLPMEEIKFKGKIVNQNNIALSNIKIKLNEVEIITSNSGSFEANKIDPNEPLTLLVEENGYKTYTKTFSPVELKTAINLTYNFDFVLIDENISEKVTLQGIVKNPSVGNVSSAEVSVNELSTLTNNDGQFTLEIEVDNNIILNTSKDNFKTSSISLDAISLLNKEIYDLETIAIYSPSSTFTFGGSRGIPSVKGEIYRGFKGINFTFTSSSALINGDHVELFIDTGISFTGRDSSDYRIDFNSDNGVSIVNFGNGSNNVASKSGITNNSYLKGTTYYMDTFIPYEFLNVDVNDLIGISAGVYSAGLRDWDGWNFAGDGFADYVAPELSNQYARIGLDNGLYRAKDNLTFATKVYGVVYADDKPLNSATVNGFNVNEDGSYALWLVNNKDTTLAIRSNGYLPIDKLVSAKELNGAPLELNFNLVLSLATISGTINVDGVTVYLEADEEISVISANGQYEISIPTDANAYLIFVKKGYETLKKGFGKASLIQSAATNKDIIFNVNLAKL